VPVVPFRVFSLTARSAGVTASDRPLGIGCSSRVLGPLKQRPHWLSVATLPLAVSSAVWLFLSGLRRAPFSVQSNPLFEFGLPPEYYPTRPSRPAAAGQLLSWAFVPYSTSGAEGPLTAGLPTCYVPPSGFGYPLGGLLPSIPCRSCFVPAALVGFTLRSFLLAEGIRSVTTRTSPHTVSPVGAPAAEAVDRPNRPQLLGFDPSESPWRPPGFWPGDHWMLPWVSPF
jgi:hypothetical protein